MFTAVFWQGKFLVRSFAEIPMYVIWHKTFDFIKRKCQGKTQIANFVSDIKVKDKVIAYMARRHRRKRHSSPHSQLWRYVELSCRCHALAALSLKKNGGAHWLGGWMGPRAALNFSGDKKTSLDWNSISVHPPRSTFASYWLALPLVVSEYVWKAIGGENIQSFKEIGEFQMSWSFMYEMTEVFRCCCDGRPKYSVKTSNYLISITVLSFRQWQYFFLPTD